jgi:hypothetical protein
MNMTFQELALTQYLGDYIFIAVVFSLLSYFHKESQTHIMIYVCLSVPPNCVLDKV